MIETGCKAVIRETGETIRVVDSHIRNTRGNPRFWIVETLDGARLATVYRACELQRVKG